MPLYEFVCECGRRVLDFRHRPLSPTTLTVPCPSCGKRMTYRYGVPLAITNPDWLDSKGRPSDPGARFMHNWQEKKKADERIMPIEKLRIRQDKEAAAERRRQGKTPTVIYTKRKP